tara:strand:+ start:755 stop:1333 length:579 start_codon:yes stop_codon:yes gene_type:complete
MEIDIKKISGLSLLEALVSTAIIGIGFVAILQMTTYSVHSINTSGDRTKANYLTNMMAEDVIGHKNVKTSGVQNFSEYLSQNQPDLNFCDNPAQKTATTAGNVYGANNNDGALMKTNKWTAIFNNKNYLGCKGKNERRSFRMFMLTGTGMSGAIDNANINDEIMYVGRIQMGLNDGRKRKFLYFQSDYILKP